MSDEYPRKNGGKTTVSDRGDGTKRVTKQDKYGNITSETIVHENGVRQDKHGNIIRR